MLQSKTYVFAGNNKDENTTLDKKYRRSREDWWLLHAGANTSGSHVFVKSPSDDDLVASAQIAAYHSKARESQKPVYVIYCKARDLKCGARAGEVIFPSNSSRLKVVPVLPCLDCDIDCQ